MQPPKRILLIDFDDSRRVTRVSMLKGAGYEVEVRNDWITSEELDKEGHFDLVILGLHREDLEGAAAYADRLRRSKPALPVLLLTDTGVFAPKGTLSESIETGRPAALMKQVAAMLAKSTHIRELAGE